MDRTILNRCGALNAVLLLLLIGPSFSFGREIKEGREVVLAGRIEKTWDFGAPNYGENPATDDVEHYFVLILDTPISSFDDEGDIEKNVTRIQLIAGGRESKTWKALASVGRNIKVQINGRLEIHNTGHHHERLLIDVEGVKATSTK